MNNLADTRIGNPLLTDVILTVSVSAKASSTPTDTASSDRYPQQIRRKELTKIMIDFFILTELFPLLLE